MTDENIEIRVTDKVSKSISDRLREIAKGARESDASLKNLQSQLASIKVSTGLARLQTELSRNSIAQQRLATETNKTNASLRLIEIQSARVAQAEAKAAQETSKLAASQTRAATESQKLAAASQRLQTEQQRTAAAASAATTAAQRLATEQQRTAAASSTAATAAQRLNTEQQRTVAAAAQAAASLQRQQAAALGTSAAQERLRGSIASADAANVRLAASQTRANTAATQGQSAIQNLATAVERTRTAATQATTAAQRLNTEQQRTSTQAHNAAAASDRAALAALRLANAQTRLSSSSSAASSSLRSYAAAAAAAIGVSVSGAGIIEMGDAYLALQNKLVNVTETQGQVNKLTDELFKVANRSLSSIDATTTAFARFDRALKGMGKSQEETLRMTETINKALVIGGSNAQEAASALLQLSQGFNAGRLQGDEFKAVAENMPIALDAVAKTMGVTVGELKKLGSEGKITSKVLFDAFSSIEKEVDTKFAKTFTLVANSVTVLKNNSVQMFGEFSKNIGLTQGLANLILKLSENLDLVAAAAAITGVAMLVYFGPTLLTALSVATKAVWTLTAAIASNPIGLLIVGITAAITYIALFGDEIKVTADGLTNLQDVAKAVWYFISDAISTVSGIVKDSWNNAVDSINAKTNGWGENFRDLSGLLLSIVKGTVNLFIAAWITTYNVISTVWSNFPALMSGYFATVVNAGAGAVENLVNSWQTGLRLIAKGASAVAPETAAGLNSALDSVSIKIPRMDVTEGKKAAGELKTAFTSAFNVDYLGKGFDAVMGKAAEISKKRRADAAKAAAAELRGSGVSTLAKEEEKAKKAKKETDKAAKAAEKRALSMSKVNLELDNELSRMFLLSPQREAQARFDQIEESFLQKKIKLSEAEKNSIKSKIKAIQDATIVQKQFDRIYEEAVAPLRDYNATQEAASKLLKMNAITQAQYNQEIVKSKEAYENAIDPMREYNKNLSDQEALFNVLPQYREVENQLQQLSNEMLQKGIVLNDTELAQMRERLTLLQESNAIAQQESALMNEAFGKRQAYVQQLMAINNLKNNSQSGFTKADTANAAMSANSDLDFTNTSEMFESNIAKYEDMYNRIKMLRDADLISEQTANALKQKTWIQQQNQTLNKAGDFFGQMSQLQKSENKKMAAVGKAAAIAQAMVQTYTAATSAYAAMAPIQYVGPALGAAAAAAAVVAGMANVQSIKAQSTGFMNGGYTGNMARDQIAGNVHGQEFVMTAATTSRVGVQDLQALQDGSASVQRNGKNVGNGSNVSVKIENYGTSKDFEVQQIDTNTVRIIARDEAEKVVTTSLNSPNSPISKAVKQNFNTSNRRG